jgi:hypothetical protein
VSVLRLVNIIRLKATKKQCRRLFYPDKKQILNTVLISIGGFHSRMVMMEGNPSNDHDLSNLNFHCLIRLGVEQGVKPTLVGP